jgi:hypothetical protein
VSLPPVPATAIRYGIGTEAMVLAGEAELKALLRQSEVRNETGAEKVEGGGR